MNTDTSGLQHPQYSDVYLQGLILTDHGSGFCCKTMQADAFRALAVKCLEDWCLEGPVIEHPLLDLLPWCNSFCFPSVRRMMHRLSDHFNLFKHWHWLNKKATAVLLINSKSHIGTELKGFFSSSGSMSLYKLMSHYFAVGKSTHGHNKMF